MSASKATARPSNQAFVCAVTTILTTGWYLGRRVLSLAEIAVQNSTAAEQSCQAQFDLWAKGFWLSSFIEVS